MMTNFLIFWQNLHLINTYWKLDSLFYLGIVTHKEVFCQIVKAGVMQILTQIEKKKKKDTFHKLLMRETIDDFYKFLGKKMLSELVYKDS